MGSAMTAQDTPSVHGGVVSDPRVAPGRVAIGQQRGHIHRVGERHRSARLGWQQIPDRRERFAGGAFAVQDPNHGQRAVPLPAATFTWMVWPVFTISAERGA